MKQAERMVAIRGLHCKLSKELWSGNGEGRKSQIGRPAGGKENAKETRVEVEARRGKEGRTEEFARARERMRGNGAREFQMKTKAKL